MGRGYAFLALLVLLPVAVAAQAQSFVFKDPNAQSAEWTQPLGAPFVDIFQLLPDNHLLVGAMGWDANSLQPRPQDLKLLSAADGTTLWTVKRKPIADGSYSVVALRGGAVVLQAASAKQTLLYAYALADGKDLWSYSIKEAAFSSALPGSDVLLLISAEHVRALDIGKGTELWDRAVAQRTANSTPGIVTLEDSVCIVAKKLACVDGTSGRERWNSSDADTAPFGRGMVVGSRLIIATDSGLTAWNITTGAQIWRTAAAIQGLIDLAADDSTLYAEWLEPTTQTIKMQAIAAADGKTKWISDPLAVPRSRLAMAGDTGYLSSAATLTAINLRAGRVTARAVLPLRLIDTDRRPDSILVQRDTVIVFGERGAASFGKADLRLLKIAEMQVGGTWPEAQRHLKEEMAVLAQTANSPGAPIQMHLGQSSALADAAKTRMDLAYARARPTLESPSSSHAEKAGAHAYVAQEISGSISMQQQANQMARLEATADLMNAALGLLEAIQAVKRREQQSKIGLLQYLVLADDLRSEATPPGFALAGEASRIEVFDSGKNAIADVYHSSESTFGWVHVALVTEDGSHLISAHVGHAPSEHKTYITSEIKRPDLNIESYALANSTWKAAQPAAVDDDLITGIRSGKISSLMEPYGPCYLNRNPLMGRKTAVTLAAISGHNIAVLKEMRLNGAPQFSSPAFGLDAAVVARDLMDSNVTAVVEDAAAREAADFQVGAAVRLNDREKVRTALDRGGSPDGLAPLSETQTCSYPPIQWARSEAVRSLLLERGAHVNILDGKSKTPLDAALAAKDTSLERFLRAHGAKTAAELTQSH
jgi:PQQ-like domain